MRSLAVALVVLMPRMAHGQAVSCAHPLAEPDALDTRVPNPEYLVLVHDSADVMRSIARFAARYGVSPSRVYHRPTQTFAAPLDSAALDGLRCDPAVRWIQPSRILCTMAPQPGIVVTVTDARDESAAGAWVTGVVRDGTYADSLRAFENDPAQQRTLTAAYDRPGTYTIELRRPGYYPWVRSGVRVVRGVCHVEKTQIMAALVPVIAP